MSGLRRASSPTFRLHFSVYPCLGLAINTLRSSATIDNKYKETFIFQIDRQDECLYCAIMNENTNSAFGIDRSISLLYKRSAIGTLS
jgi:hypothetical protein